MSKVKKHKLSRREGVDLFGTGGESLAKRLGQPPGMHGKRPGRKPSEYAVRLREKQKVKRTYGLREKQFLDFFRRAQKNPQQTGAALLVLLERRLDNVVYRLSFARTRLQARQLVSHGHVLVNGGVVDIPSFITEPGQVITLDQKAPNMPGVRSLVENPAPVPAWLQRTGLTGAILREPDRSEIDKNINEQFIVEFYSR